MTSLDATIWDGRCEVSLAAFIRRYLAENPAPQGSRVKASLEEYATLLEFDGLERLARTGARRLALAGGGGLPSLKTMSGENGDAA